MSAAPETATQPEAKILSALQAMPQKHKRKTAHKLEPYRAEILMARKQKNASWNEIAKILTDAGLTTSGSYLRKVIEGNSKKQHLAKSQSKKPAESMNPT